MIGLLLGLAAAAQPVPAGPGPLSPPKTAPAAIGSAQTTAAAPDRPPPAARADAQAQDSIPLPPPRILPRTREAAGDPDAQQAAPASSGGPTALDLMKQCYDGSISGSIVNPACVGYLAGYVGAVRIAATAVDDFPICLPESGLANEDIVSGLSSYLEEHKTALGKSARSVVFLVLSDQFPCKGAAAAGDGQ